jgi:hypothetical protein
MPRVTSLVRPRRDRVTADPRRGTVRAILNTHDVSTALPGGLARSPKRLHQAA